jgi:riboflavin kinase/FMN adenylyltransferase
MVLLPDPRVAILPGVFALSAPLPGSVVTLGTFDGVHLGHRELMRRASTRAEADGLPCVAYTFDPHPAKVLAPQAAPPVMVPIPIRARLLTELGADLVVVEPFTLAFAAVSASEWVLRFLHGQLRPSHVVVGFNFSYGHERGGDPKHLAAMGEQLGFSVEVVPAVESAGEVVSSTRLRKALEAGDVELARRLLGRPFSLVGKVVEGQKRGRSIGFPTANLDLDGELLPRQGVYASVLGLEDGRRLPAVTNIGVRPTFGAGSSIETHVLDFDEKLYGARVAVSLVARIRDEKKFAGLTELVAQIQQDIREARVRLVDEVGP